MALLQFKLCIKKQSMMFLINDKVVSVIKTENIRGYYNESGYQNCPQIYKQLFVYKSMDLSDQKGDHLS